MSIDVESVRVDTPGVAHVNHLLASGSALMPQPVIDAVVGHLEVEALVGGYRAEALGAADLDAVYDSLACLLGADRDEIAVLENATAAWCQAFYSLPLEPGDRVLTCEAEYAANYVALLHRARRDGIEIGVIPSDPVGSIDLEALGDMLDERVKLIAITWVPTNGGLVNPAAGVGRIARENGVTFLLDGCQAIGQMPVDVADIGCDFLTGTGRKFLRGPRGTGFMYVRSSLLETLEPVMIDHFAAPWVEVDHYELRSDARRFETWENSYALRAGLRTAVDYALDLGLPAIQCRAWSLADRLRGGLSALRGAELRDLGETKSAIVSFTLDGLDPRTVVTHLAARGIEIGSSEPSSTRLDAEARELPTVLRAAPHYYNTELEIDALLEELSESVRGQR